MYQRRNGGGFTPKENSISAMPSTVAGVLVLLGLILTSLFQFELSSQLSRLTILVFGALACVYLIIFHLFLIPLGKHRNILSWGNAILGGLALGFLPNILPDEADLFLGVLLILGTISTSIIADRVPSYTFILLSTILGLVFHLQEMPTLAEFMQHGSFVILAIITVETVQQLKHLANNQIRRLEIINEFSRGISGTLNKEQVVSLLNAAIQNSLEADSYFVGLVDGDEISLGLLYDDGEFFNGVRTKSKGTLSGWVINNQKELFLPDLRNDVDLEGVQTVIIGKEKTNLSWMGVPMRGTFVNGVIAIASYEPNAFDRSDLELLLNLAQHAGLALDNALRHSQVEEQSHLDHLTNVYNHGYFLNCLKTMTDAATLNQTSLSLIMLDVDHFKQYNDTYGHLAGDEILMNLCRTIQGYIKQTDAVGRWGGEEFVIALPNADGEQAMQVANRIRQAMFSLHIHNREQKTIPAPTVSQGIALFPNEAKDPMKLIDLADHRLYIAKERGRNQIEPSADHYWHGMQH